MVVSNISMFNNRNGMMILWLKPPTSSWCSIGSSSANGYLKALGGGATAFIETMCQIFP